MYQIIKNMCPASCTQNNKWVYVQQQRLDEIMVKVKEGILED